MSNKEKGNRRERQAKNILEECGWTVETPNETPYKQEYGVDFFGLFDFIAFKNGKIIFGQVKSNRARGIREFPEKCKEIDVPFEKVEVEFWVCHDNEGWRIFTITSEEYIKEVDERDENCNMGEKVKEYKNND